MLNIRTRHMRQKIVGSGQIGVPRPRHRRIGQSDIVIVDSPVELRPLSGCLNLAGKSTVTLIPQNREDALRSLGAMARFFQATAPHNSV